MSFTSFFFNITDMHKILYIFFSREDISRLPRDVSDPAAIQRLDSGDAAEKLAAEVRAAAKLLEVR